MVWLPGRGYVVASAPPTESTDEVSDEAASDPSTEGLVAVEEVVTGVVGGASPFPSAPSPSLFRVVRQFPTEPERWGVVVPDLVSSMSSRNIKQGTEAVTHRLAAAPFRATYSFTPFLTPCSFSIVGFFNALAVYMLIYMFKPIKLFSN